MKLYLYDNATLNYIGEFTTGQTKPISPGTLILFEKKKYLVVTSEPQPQPNVFVVTVDPR